MPVRPLLVLALALLALSAAGAAPEPVRVGILHSRTGTMASSEQPLIDAALLAVEEVNRAGGVLGGRKLQPIVEDGASDPAAFARAAEKLIVRDRVRALFGCWTSASRKAVLPVVEKRRHLLWYPLQYEGYESSPRVIYTGAAPNQQLLPALEWCRKRFGSRALLVGSDYVFPRLANRLLRQRLQQRGGTVTAEIYRPLGSRDFAEVVTAVKAHRPDFVLNTVNGDSNHALFATLKAAGLDQVPVMSFSLAEVELQALKDVMPVGQYCAWNYFQSIDTRENRRFVQAFQDRYGADRVTDDPMAAAYVGVHLYARALEKAGSDQPDDALRAARGLIFEAPEGLIRIDPGNQHTWKVARVGQITAEGQFRILWSSELPIRPEPRP